MAKSHARFSAAALAARDFASAARDLQVAADKLVAFHLANDFSDAATASPAYVTTSEDGNIAGFDFAVADYANVIYAAQQLAAWFDTGFAETLRRVSDAR